MSGIGILGDKDTSSRGGPRELVDSCVYAIGLDPDSGIFYGMAEAHVTTDESGIVYVREEILYILAGILPT